MTHPPLQLPALRCITQLIYISLAEITSVDQSLTQVVRLTEPVPQPICPDPKCLSISAAVAMSLQRPLIVKQTCGGGYTLLANPATLAALRVTLRPDQAVPALEVQPRATYDGKAFAVVDRALGPVVFGIESAADTVLRLAQLLRAATADPWRGAVHSLFVASPPSERELADWTGCPRATLANRRRARSR